MILESIACVCEIVHLLDTITPIRLHLWTITHTHKHIMKWSFIMELANRAALLAWLFCETMNLACTLHSCKQSRKPITCCSRHDLFKLPSLVVYMKEHLRAPPEIDYRRRMSLNSSSWQLMLTPQFN